MPEKREAKNAWITTKDGRAKFWATANKLKLSKEETHEALDFVESVYDFTGTFDEALALIAAYAELRSKTATKHWADDEKQRAKFWATTAGMRVDNTEVKSLLGIEDLREFPGSIGDALNMIQDAPAAQTKAVPPAVEGDLYPDDKTRILAAAIARVAPWAHNNDYPLDAADIALAVRRAIDMGLDPLNPHEVQIWKDKRGMNFQLAYTLLHQWSTQILGGHTEPRYTRLTEDELKAEGLNITDTAYYCEFVMKEDISLIGTMIQAGWDPLQARAELTVTGLGTATQSEWGNRYFAPKGRSKAWKVQKRAYTDAIRTRFGIPGRNTIEKMRHLRGEQHITATDWQLTAGTAEEQVQLAALTATDREREPDTRTPEEILAHNRAILHGDQELLI